MSNREYNIAFYDTSPAIDAGNPSGCTDDNGDPLNTDATGTAREDGNGDTLVRCDIGSFEFSPAACAISGPSAAPGILAPGSNAKVSKTRVKLKWTQARCVNEYRVTLWRKGTAAPIDSKTGLTKTSYKTKPLALNQKYQWQVQACYNGQCKTTSKSKFSTKP